MKKQIVSNGENILLVIIISISIFAYLETYDFSSDTKLFPRVNSGIIIVLGAMILFRNQIPTRIKKAVFEDSALIDHDSVQEEAQQGAMYSDQENDINYLISTVNRSIPDNILIIFLTGFYIVLGFLIGFLWATPIYATLYAVWFRMSLVTSMILTITTSGIVFAFNYFLFLRLEFGYFEIPILPNLVPGGGI